jgi:hypothetical protein
MPPTSEPILFDAEIRQVKTMVDHSVNLTLNIPEYELDAVAKLLQHMLDFARVAIQVENQREPE